jgi:hypothetical protein
MADFTISENPVRKDSHFAVGRDTGSLFLMIGPAQGIVLIGYAELRGQEGQLHVVDADSFRRLPRGTTIEITA